MDATLEKFYSRVDVKHHKNIKNIIIQTQQSDTDTQSVDVENVIK